MATEIKVRLKQISGSTSEAAIRNHRLCIDRPEAKGGADAGPMGGELFLAAVGGCFMSNLLAAIKARGADVSDATVEVTGTLAEAPARFAQVELRVAARCAEPAVLRHLTEIADRGCIMTNTLRSAAELKLSVGIAE